MVLNLNLHLLKKNKRVKRPKNVFDLDKYSSLTYLHENFTQLYWDYLESRYDKLTIEDNMGWLAGDRYDDKILSGDMSYDEAEERRSRRNRIKVLWTDKEGLEHLKIFPSLKQADDFMLQLWLKGMEHINSYDDMGYW